MYRREALHQLSFEDFFLPFGSKPSGNNSRIKLHALIPWDELEDDYASQSCRGFGAQAKPYQMALGALIIKGRLGRTDEDLLEQIKENLYLQFFIGLKAFQDAPPFNPSMMMYFRKRLLDAVVNDCNERIVRHAVIKSKAAEETDDDQHGGFVSGDHQQVQATKVESNQGSLLINATCAPADIRHPTDLSLLNEACEVTEKLIDAMHPQARESFGSKPLTYRK